MFLIRLTIPTTVLTPHICIQTAETMNNKLKTYQIMRKAILLSVLFALPALANAFSGKAKVGGIWYNIVTKAEKAEVTKPDVGNYSGIIKIPSTIVYEGVTCKVTAIGSGAFAWGEMTSVTIPNTVTKIDAVAFRWCENLKSISIPNSVTEIGPSAFDGCLALSSVSLSQSIKKIDNSVFKGCKSLKSIVIPEGVTNIDMYAFSGCTSLTSATLNNGLDSISSDAFSNSGLTAVTVPNSVRIIDDNAFKECSRLASVTLGSGVQKISFGAFEKCGDLKDFYVNGDRLPVMVNNSNPFIGSEIEYTTLHVAESLVELCKQVEPWKSFGKVVINPNATTEEVDATADETIYEPSDCNGQFPTPFMERYELGKWLDEHVQYPEEAKAKGISGTTVAVNFVVEPDGSISNVKADEGSWPELVPEAERVVKSMPKWNAGKVNGEYARVKERIAVHFQLSEQEINAARNKGNTGEPIYDAANEMPSFPGGSSSIQAWIKEHLQITDEIKDWGVGRVMVKFVVEKDGTITNAEMMFPMHPAIDKEATRVIESMPKWNPGRINGQPVRVKYKLPVIFK